VFTDRPLEGNQLGVFVDARSFKPEQMQRLARELNFSETCSSSRLWSRRVGSGPKEFCR
jgi:hypothetical protein